MNKLDISLKKETQKQREVDMEITPADIRNIETFVDEMKQPGQVVEGKTLKTYRASELKRFWKAENN